MHRVVGIVRRRVLQMIPVILGIIIFNFLLLHMAPGDAVDVIAGEAGAGDAAYVAKLRAEYGLDQPLIVQLGRYVLQVLQFDLGHSFRQNMPVSELILDRLPATLLLMLVALAMSFLLGLTLGVVAAWRVRTMTDNVISVVALLSYATPTFWIGLMLILLFSVTLGWLPTTGMESIGAGYTGLERIVDIGRHLLLPAVTLSLFYMAIYTRLMRASMLEVYGQDYVRTAQAKGLADSRVAFKHVLRNAMLPVVTMAGIQVGSLLGGSVLVETVFGWPGLGRLAYDAVFQRDFNLLLGVLLLSSVLVVAANLIVDLLYAALDPRIEFK
ncbi:MAG: ABC transporter permease [Alphaproteobacteria bacterium]